MKKLYAATCIFFLLSAFSILQAQEITPPLNQQVTDKPMLFNALPEKLECNLEEIDRLFTAQPSQKLVLRLNNYLQLDGAIVEKVQKSPEVTTINFRANNYKGTLFTISRSIQNGYIRYTGRIISKDNGDVLMLVKDNEKYYFTKQLQRFVMVE
ncbi:MAG TPA: hypothetical protein VD996_00110 [Chitinophagaceae bacterium]|nr:hypothetical protein [Chitinophagaceae bacterium]